MPGYPDPGFDTLALHAGAGPDPSTGARAVPIHLTTSFVFESSEHAASLFNLERAGHVYSRISNPTNAVLEQRISALEGGIGAIATASGQAALHLSIATLMGAGSHIVASTALYGGSHNLLHDTLRRFGIDTSFVPPGDHDAWRAAVRPNTKLFFGETVGNPGLDVLDIEAVAAIAHAEDQFAVAVEDDVAAVVVGGEVVDVEEDLFAAGHAARGRRLQAADARLEGAVEAAAEGAVEVVVEGGVADVEFAVVGVVGVEGHAQQPLLAVAAVAGFDAVAQVAKDRGGGDGGVVCGEAHDAAAAFHHVHIDVVTGPLGHEQRVVQHHVGPGLHQREVGVVDGAVGGHAIGVVGAGVEADGVWVGVGAGVLDLALALAFAFAF